VTATRGDEYITRHTSFIRKLSGTAKGKDDEGTTTDDESGEDNIRRTMMCKNLNC
jgi:hypothetical protein